MKRKQRECRRGGGHLVEGGGAMEGATRAQHARVGGWWPAPTVAAGSDVLGALGFRWC